MSNQTHPKKAELSLLRKTAQSTRHVVSSPRPSRQEAEDAVRTLLRFIGDDPGREGLLETPARVLRSYEEFFSGYSVNEKKVLGRVFHEVGGYHDMVVLKDIDIVSHCEHHLLPIIGKVHVAYIPDKKVVGISKLARVVEVFARRLQIQEKLTAEIAKAIDTTLAPLGVGVMVDAVHHCMAIRGVNKSNVTMRTKHFTGLLAEDGNNYRKEFFDNCPMRSISDF